MILLLVCGIPFSCGVFRRLSLSFRWVNSNVTPYKGGGSGLKPNAIARVAVSGSLLVCVAFNTLEIFLTNPYHNTDMREVKNNQITNLGLGIL
jgi:hypothetical protein